jgi:hypothetical protein
MKDQVSSVATSTTSPNICDLRHNIAGITPSITLFYRYTLNGVADRGQNDTLIFRAHLKILNHLVQSNGIISRKVLNIVTLHNLTVLPHQNCMCEKETQTDVRFEVLMAENVYTKRK